MSVDLSITRALPPRRESLRQRLTFTDPFGQPPAQVNLYVTVGLDPADGKVGEIFIRPGGQMGKNSLLERLLDDAAVLLSHCLQRGMSLADLARAVGYSERSTTLGSASPIAEAIAAAIELERTARA